MNEKVEKLEIKRLIQEYNFLLLDDEYKQEVISENKIEFLSKIQKLKQELGLIYDYEQEAESENEKNEREQEEKGGKQESELKDEEEKGQDGKEQDGKENKKSKKPKIDPNSVNQTTKDKIKKLYREIVKRTHPDKTNSEKLINLYLKATTAVDEYNLFELFIICIELDIEIEIDNEDKETLMTLVNMKKSELRNIELSFIWLYANSKTEEEKNNLVELFVKKHGTKN